MALLIKPIDLGPNHPNKIFKNFRKFFLDNFDPWEVNWFDE